MKKKILALALVVAMLAISVVSGTLAYFTDTDSAENVITIGSVSAELYESKYHRGSPTGYLSITGQPNPTLDEHIIADSANYEAYLDSVDLMPFDTRHNQTMFEECTVAKNAYVKNTGNTDAFVRVRYIVPKDVAQYLDIFYVGTQFIPSTDAVATADARTLNNTDGTEPMISYVNPTAANFVAQGAKQDANGDYYVDFIYAERLTPGEMTLYSPISKITLVPTATSEQIAALNLPDREFIINVEAEVIQADGFLNALEAFAAYDGQ